VFHAAFHWHIFSMDCYSKYFTLLLQIFYIVTANISHCYCKYFTLLLQIFHIVTANISYCNCKYLTLLLQIFNIVTANISNCFQQIFHIVTGLNVANEVQLNMSNSIICYVLCDVRLTRRGWLGFTFMFL